MAEPEPTADPTRVMPRRCAAYLIDLTLVATGMFIVLYITGDVEKVPNCDTIPKGRACFGYQDQALLGIRVVRRDATKHEHVDDVA